MKSTRRNDSGFTLLELLVVIAIIGLLSTITMMSLANARAQARDAKRLADIEQIQLVLELYADDNGEEYPRTYGSPDDCSKPYNDSSTKCDVSKTYNWITHIVPKYAQRLPVDPRGFPQFADYEYRSSDKFGYIITFRLERSPQQDECQIDYVGGTYVALSTRCAPTAH